MELKDAQALIFNQVNKNLKHIDYVTVTNLATKLQILITGNNSNLLLRRMVNRETDAAFIQRCAITRTITPAVAASVKIPFYKVARNQRIKTNIDVKDEVKNEAIQKMTAGFYGSSGRQTKGLDYWLKTRFMDLTFTDPNAWVVVEWDAPNSPADILQTRPFEVSSAEAYNFKIINEEVFWLFCCFPNTYNDLDGKNPITKTGVKYTLYEKTYTITYEQCSPDYLKSIGFVLAPNQTFNTTATSGVTYIETVNTPKLNFVPAYRIGYIRDLSTNARTYVNPFNDGMSFFDISLKTVSEFQLTMSQHAFPQKIQYASPCRGNIAQNLKCNGGFLSDGSMCQVCGGTGFAGIKSTMDTLNLPLPTPGTPNNEIMDLSKLIAYVAPDIKLIQFQNSYIQQLKNEVHQAVFNSQVFVRKSGAGGASSGVSSSDGQSFQTATENDNNMQSVYDALEPFTEKFSDLWEDIVTVFAILSNVTDIDNVDIDHVFPADFKLKTTDILLGELRVIQDSGAPSFMKDRVGADLAEIIFAGDALGLLKYRVQRKFFPFNGKGPDEIALLLASPDVPRRSKILYSNYDAIFVDVEQANPSFYTLQNYDQQLEMLNKVIEQYKALITADSPAILDINALRQQMTALPSGVDPGDNPPKGNATAAA